MTKSKTKPKRKRLTDIEKAFVVQELACFGTPKEVSEALMEQFGVQLAPQNCEAYDPGKRAGQHLSKKWRQLFEHTRQAFLAHVEQHVPEAHKAVRIRHLAHASRAYRGQKNYVAMADMLERIAKECGGSFTNQRQLTGKDGGPMQYQDVKTMTDEELLAELRRLGYEPDVHLASAGAQ